MGPQESSNTEVHKHQFFGTQPSLWSNDHTFFLLHLPPPGLVSARGSLQPLDQLLPPPGLPTEQALLQKTSPQWTSPVSMISQMVYTLLFATITFSTLSNFPAECQDWETSCEGRSSPLKTAQPTYPPGLCSLLLLTGPG